MPADGVHVSVPELRRLGPDALRGAGLALAQADEAALMVTWTEAAIGGALAEVAARPERSPSSDAEVAVRTARPRVVVVDAGGRSLLEVGLRLADFACAEASRTPGTRVVARGTAGAPFLPYLVRRCARLGYRAVGWHVAADAGGAWAAAAWPRRPDRATERRLVVVRPASDPDDEALAIPDDLRDLLAGAGDALVLSCDRPTAAATGRSPSTVATHAAALAAHPRADTESETRFATALRDGLVLDPADHAAFGALATAIRVPTSERSRGQAG